MRRLVLLLPLLLAGCDTSTPFSGGFFGDPYLSVYEFQASGDEGVLTSGQIALTLLPSDVFGAPDGWSGRWDLDARGEGGAMLGAVDGRGSIRGETLYNDDYSTRAIELTFFDDVPREGVPREPIGYVLRGQFDVEGERFSGTWESFGGFTGDVVKTGTFEAHLSRRATQFIIAG